MTLFDLAQERYDWWRTAAPPEPDYDYDEFVAYADAHPDAGYDPDSVDDFERWAALMEQEDAEARADVLIDRAEGDRIDDDHAYWKGL